MDMFKMTGSIIDFLSLFFLTNILIFTIAMRKCMMFFLLFLESKKIFQDVVC